MTDEDHIIVKIDGRAVYVPAAKVREFNERMRDLDGDWSWEQEVQLDALRKERERLHPIPSDADAHRVVMDLIRNLRRLTEINERAKQDVSSISEKPGTKMVRIDGSYPGASYPCARHIPPRPEGIVILPPPPSYVDKLRVRRGYWSMLMLAMIAVAFVNSFVSPGWPGWAQWLDLAAWISLTGLGYARVSSLTRQIKRIEDARPSVTYTPLPGPGYRPKKSNSEQYADKFVETGQLMYKYLMEDAYAEEHAHDFDIEEL